MFIIHTLFPPISTDIRRIHRLLERKWIRKSYASLISGTFGIMGARVNTEAKNRPISGQSTFPYLTVESLWIDAALVFLARSSKLHCHVWSRYRFPRLADIPTHHARQHSRLHCNAV